MEARKNKIVKTGDMSALDHLEAIKRNNRSKRVADHEFGMIRTADAETRDKPVYAVLMYDESGQLVYEDYSKLEEYIEKTLIPKNIKETRIRDPKNNLPTIEKTIQGNVITKLRLSEKEIEYTIDYLSKKGILVRGIDSSLDDGIEGYQYISTYKSQPLPEAFSMIKNFEVFSEYKRLREAVKKLPDTSPDKKKMTEQIIQIRNKLVEGNMRLVYDLIQKKIKVLPQGMSEDDLYQIGYEILIKFIENYDIEKGAFSTYVYNYLVYHIQRHYDEYKAIHIPVHMEERIRKISKVQKAIEQVKGSKATEEEIAEELDLSVEQVEECLKIMRINESESYDEYREKKEIDQDSIDEEELEYDEMEATSYVPSVETEALNKILSQDLAKILDTLTPREKEVLMLRFGFVDGRTYTLEETAEIYGLTRERIRQIENKAIRKLRHPKRAKQIRNYHIEESNDRDYVHRGRRH